jgi:hypothetical protein
LRQQIDARGKKSALNDYLACIERYFVPYFGERLLEELTHTDIREFELWRDRQLKRRPKTSMNRPGRFTLANLRILRNRNATCGRARLVCVNWMAKAAGISKVSA